MTPDERRERAEQVAGSHYECEDCWYSCLLSDGGCCDDRQPKECNCGRDERIKRIMHELRDAEARGWEEASACLGKRATYYSETQEVDRFTRAIQLNEVRGCIDALKQGAKQLREGT